jgi:hypothetical protein
MVAQNVVNHVGLVLDRSYSMTRLARQVVEIADAQVKELATISTQMDQETRATVYVFDDDVECIYYDKDVLRLPSLSGKYRIGANTAMIDATMQAITDLEKSATLYGDHAFLLYVLTDGEENQSRKYGARELREKISKLPDNWTVAALVPDVRGEAEARRYGFLPGNIAIWSTSEGGLLQAGGVIRQATSNFMQGRAAGLRGSKNLFQASTKNLDPKQLKVLSPLTYTALMVGPDDGGVAIRDFVNERLGAYKKGQGYYQLTKKEEVQPSKDVLLMGKTGDVYYGVEAREMIGVPSGTYADVMPENHPDYTIFVRSDSVNRKLVPNTLLIVRR